MKTKMKISPFAHGIILITGVFLARQTDDRLGKNEAFMSGAQLYKKIAEPKYRPINPPADVMVNPLVKPRREGDLCVIE